MTSSGRLVPVYPSVEEEVEEVEDDDDEEEEDIMALVSGSGVVSLPSTTRSPAHTSSLSEFSGTPCIHCLTIRGTLGRGGSGSCGFYRNFAREVAFVSVLRPLT